MLLSECISLPLAGGKQAPSHSHYHQGIRAAAVLRPQVLKLESLILFTLGNISVGPLKAHFFELLILFYSPLSTPIPFPHVFEVHPFVYVCSFKNRCCFVFTYF